MRTRHGFTLVEMLVVIGIIALLIAMLLPGLTRARGQAMRVACESNLRQLNQATLFYATDNHEYLPYPNWANMDGYYPYPGWLYKPGTPFTPAAVHTSALWPYIKIESVYKCQTDPGPFFNGTTHAMTSYIMNGAVCGFGRPDRLPSFKLHSFRPDAIIYWEADPTRGGGEWNDGGNIPPEGLATRHRGGAAVGVLDGHVDWLPVPDYNRLLNKSPGPLWCNPGSVDGH